MPDHKKQDVGDCNCYFDNSTKQPKVGNISQSEQIIYPVDVMALEMWEDK